MWIQLQDFKLCEKILNSVTCYFSGWTIVCVALGFIQKKLEYHLDIVGYLDNVSNFLYLF